MPAFTTIALSVATAAALAGTAYQVHESKVAQHESEDIASEQKGAQDKLLNDAKEKEAQDQATQANTAARNAARSKQRQALQSVAPGTDLGGGVIAPPQGKTLLGM
jgi:uncharacterized membrane protein